MLLRRRPGPSAGGNGTCCGSQAPRRRTASRSRRHRSSPPTGLLPPNFQRRMPPNTLERLRKQGKPRLHPVPRRSPGRMRKRNAVHLVSRVINPKLPADGVVQHAVTQKPRDRQFAHRNHQPGTQQLHLRLKPRRTGLHLFIAGDSIPSRRFFPGKTAANGCKIDPGSRLLFAPAHSPFEPTEQRSPCCPGKRPSHYRLFVPRRLTDQKHPARHSPPNHNRGVHLRTTTAGSQRLKVGLHLLKGSHCGSPLKRCRRMHANRFISPPRSFSNMKKAESR